MSDFATKLSWFNVSTMTTLELVTLSERLKDLQTGCIDKEFILHERKFPEATRVSLPGYLFDDVLWQTWIKINNELASRFQNITPPTRD